MEERNKNYYDLLKEAVGDSGNYDGILRYLPDFYLLLCRMACDKKSNWYAKMLVNTALAYLVLRKDRIPENEKVGTEGYLDDLFLCAHVLKEIRDKISKETILENVEGLQMKKDTVLDSIYEVHTKSSSYLENKTTGILDYVGLTQFRLLDLMYVNDKVTEITRNKKKMKLLYAMIAVKSKTLLGKGRSGRRFENIKEHLMSHPDFPEIERYMEFDAYDE